MINLPFLVLTTTSQKLFFTFVKTQPFTFAGVQNNYFFSFHSTKITRETTRDSCCCWFQQRFVSFLSFLFPIYITYVGIPTILVKSSHSSDSARLRVLLVTTQKHTNCHLQTGTIHVYECKSFILEFTRNPPRLCFCLSPSLSLSLWCVYGSFLGRRGFYASRRLRVCLVDLSDDKPSHQSQKTLGVPFYQRLANTESEELFHRVLSRCYFVYYETIGLTDRSTFDILRKTNWLILTCRKSIKKKTI